jgi:hypothetical protein
MFADAQSLGGEPGYRRQMLHEFLTSHRRELITRCKERVTKRFAPEALPAVIDHGVPLFLEQLADTLRREQLTLARGASEPEPAPASSAISRSAALHGTELLRLGYNVDQVVHDYGDICQAVTDLAIERHAYISADEFRTLNRCLDAAIADAVTAFAHDRDSRVFNQAELLHNRMGLLASEQRRLVEMAIQAFAAIKTGNIGVTGATGTALVNTLYELRDLIDRSLPEIRLASGMTTVPSGSTALAPPL